MKKTPPDQPPIDLIRLPDTQADGDLLRSTSLRPNGDLQPVSLSESSDDNVETQPEKQPTQLKQKNKEEQSNTEDAKDIEDTKDIHSSQPASNSSFNEHTSYSNNDHPNTTHGHHGRANAHFHAPVNSAALEMSTAPSSVQATWPRPLIEGDSLPPSQNEKEAAKDTTTAISSNNGSSRSNSSASTGDNITNRTPNSNNDSPGGADDGTDGEDDTAKRSKILALVISFFVVGKKAICYTWLNILLVFVPVGIAVGAAHLSPAIVFSMNAIAIVPLAGLLAFATESVARKMGDSIGALLNVTFGNAVELIIFIALVKGEIRIVQASLLGSILANLLLILGMGFLLGGLRFREQIYNSTVTQMSACLLSLSVISLVLPTAFHASFSDTSLADRESLKISRATSVVLLLVYLIYLVFQLKSHAYMYESTPQHIIDEEAEPGPAAAWLDSSSSDDSSSSSSDSDDSSHSRDTMKKRMRRVIRASRRRVSSVASLDTVEGSLTGPTRTPSFGTTTAGADDVAVDEAAGRPVLLPRLAAMNVSEEAVDEEDGMYRRYRKRHYKRSLRRSRRHKHKPSREQDVETEEAIVENIETNQPGATDSLPSYKVGESSIMAGSTKVFSGVDVDSGETRRVDFALTNDNYDGEGNTATAAELASARRAFNLRAMSLRPVAKSLTPTVFAQPPGITPPVAPTGPVPRVRFGIRRTNSLPDRLNQPQIFRAPGALLPAHIPAETMAALSTQDTDKEEEFTMSRKAAITMLLISTGLVAACAEFMVDSINGLVASSQVGEVFIGLIILPIVGNAAEHVTAVVVAMKNKMDLAIGVAVGSSIQIALFMTPLVVILGWIMDRDMTLYFTLFETVCLFVSAFMANFLVLDGRSNYLEGALLLSTYVIISILAFYYPGDKQASAWGK